LPKGSCDQAAGPDPRDGLSKYRRQINRTKICGPTACAPCRTAGIDTDGRPRIHGTLVRRSCTAPTPEIELCATMVGWSTGEGYAGCSCRAILGPRLYIRPPAGTALPFLGDRRVPMNGSTPPDLVALKQSMLIPGRSSRSYRHLPCVEHPAGIRGIC